MRFMVIVKASKDSEAGVMPSTELLTAMGKFNEEMVKAGIMLAGEGLQASSKGARIHFGDGPPRAVDGPFAESKEMIAGFWIIQTKTRQEAIEWMKRAPFDAGTTLELRQIFEPEDFAPSDPTGELMNKERELSAQIRAQQR